MFGHEKQAPLRVPRGRHHGIVEAGRQRDLFLDEVGELPAFAIAGKTAPPAPGGTAPLSGWEVGNAEIRRGARIICAGPNANLERPAGRRAASFRPDLTIGLTSSTSPFPISADPVRRDIMAAKHSGSFREFFRGVRSRVPGLRRKPNGSDRGILARKCSGVAAKPHRARGWRSLKFTADSAADALFYSRKRRRPERGGKLVPTWEGSEIGQSANHIRAGGQQGAEVASRSREGRSAWARFDPCSEKMRKPTKSGPSC